MNDITYAVSVDVNNPIIPYNVYVASVLDSNVRYLEITLYQNGNVIALSNTATATASLVTDNVLVDDSVECTISNNIITVPLEDLQRHGNLDVQVTVTEGTKVLAIPFPIQVRVTPNIAENAQIDENSLGSYAEVVHEITEARGTYTTLHDAITAKLDNAPGAVNTENLADESITVEKVADDLAEVINAKAPASTAYTFDSTTTNVVYNADNPKTIYLNATVDGEDGIVITAKDNGFQYFLGRRGALKIRYFTGGTSYSDWIQVTEHVDNKKKSITSSNRTSTEFYPSIKAVVDYLVANYEDLSNKLSSEAGIDEDSTDMEYPTAKAVFDFGVQIIDGVNEDITETNSNLSDLAEEVGDLKSAFNIIANNNFYIQNISQSGYYDRFNNGAYETNKNFICDPNTIPIESGKTKLYYANTDTTYDVCVLFYNSSNNFISVTYFLKNRCDYVTIPNNTICCRIYVNNKAFTGKLALGYSAFTEYEEPGEVYHIKSDAIEDNSIDENKLDTDLVNKINGSVESVEETEETLLQAFYFESVNLIDPSKIISGQYNTITGAYETSSKNVCSNDLIPINKKYSKLYMQFESEGQFPFLAVSWYGSDKSYINYSTKWSPDIPSDAYYFTFFTSKTNEGICISYTELQTYQEYDPYPVLKSVMKDDLIIEEWLSESVRNKLNYNQKYFGKKIVVLGDSIMDRYQVPNKISGLLGATVYNCALGGTRMGQHIYSNYGAFSFYQIANSIYSDDFSLQITNASDIGGNAVARANIMSSIDWDTVDYIIVSFGTNDFTGGNTGTFIDGDFTSITYALQYGLSKIYSANPKTKVFVVTPMYRSDVAEDAHYNAEHQTLRQIAEAIKERANLLHIPVCDDMNGLQINAYNSTAYLVDGVHPTTEGADLIAKRIAAQFCANF